MIRLDISQSRLRRLAAPRATLRTGISQSRLGVSQSLLGRLAAPRATLCGLVAIALLVSACGGGGEATLAGYEREPEPTVGSITLPAANRDTDAFAFKAEPGELLLVNFGYTSCPDICPTTMSDTRLAFAELGDRASDVNMAFVSIDPELDTAEVLTNYVETFIDGGIALRTDDPNELLIAADAFGVTYQIAVNDDGEREVGHTPNVFVVDEDGSIILTWPFGVPPEDVASDINILLDRMP